MKLTARLAHRQLITSRKRTIWTLIGIMLSTAMITAVYGFGASGGAAISDMLGDAYIRREYVVTIVAIGVILSIVIVTASVIVVSNAFRVSAGERTAQFGILKSVGATKKQITETIIYEGLLLSVIGIPAGIILGLLIQFSGLQIANHLLTDLNAVNDETLIFSFVTAWQAILLAIIVAFVTVLLSAWLPARKAAKLTAIDAIRGAGEIRVKAKQMRPNRLVRKLFGFEGALASKSLKRSRRNFRATVVSLTVSIVLFVGAGSFGAQLDRLTNLVFQPVDANVIGFLHSSMEIHYRDDGSTFANFSTISNEEAETITAKLREFPETKIFGAGSNSGGTWAYTIPIPAEMLTRGMRDHIDHGHQQEEFNLSIALVTVDAESYAELCRLAGVPLGSNILINYSRQRVGDNWAEFIPIVWSGQTLLVPHMDKADSNALHELTLHGELSGTDIPNEILHVSRSVLTVVIPRLYAGTYSWFAETADPHGFTQYMFEIFDEFIPRDGDIHVNTGVRNISAEQSSERGIVRLVMVFTYGFVGMLTLIGLTNVISTISTNVRSRSREFAVLRSVGMTHGGVKRMLNLESILCSVKALVIGLPLGVIASYLIYQAVMFSADFPYEIPWLAIAQSVLGVFAVTWITMRYAASRLRGGNIVGSIRNETV